VPFKKDSVRDLVYQLSYLVGWLPGLDDFTYFFMSCIYLFIYLSLRLWPLLWSSGQSSWLQIQRFSEFLRSSGSETESTQPREKLLERT
jgi:hypothetical protein